MPNRFTTNAVEHPGCIMLVEDDAAVRRSLQLLFRGRGHDVRAHACATTLLADPALGVASCLVADYRLGDGDGLALLVTLRERGWLKPALLITGYGSPEIVARAMAAGFTAVLEKPFSQGALAATVARLVEASPPAA